MSNLQSAPQSIEAERSLLGAILINSAAYDEVIDIAPPELIYRESHRTIYRAMKELRDSGLKVEKIALADLLHLQGNLVHVGGINILNGFENDCPSAANAEHYARLIVRSAVRRAVISDSTTNNSNAYDGDFDAMVDGVQNSALKILSSVHQHNDVHIKDAVRLAFQHVEASYKKEEGVAGIMCGIESIDDVIGGFKPQSLTIIGARPAMGKSALALNMAANMALDSKVGVGIVSLEMSVQENALRMMCAGSMVPFNDISNGTMSERSWASLIKVSGMLSECNMYIEDTPGQQFSAVSSLIRRWVTQKSVDIVFIDYLQLIKKKSASNREREIGEIAQGLKDLAKELKIPIVALAQLNRDLEKRADKRPMTSDLRESGGIEQAADIIGMLYRDVVYNDNADPKEGEFIVTKHRNGNTGVAPLRWQGDITRFLSVDVN